MLEKLINFLNKNKYIYAIFILFIIIIIFQIFLSQNKIKDGDAGKIIKDEYDYDIVVDENNLTIKSRWVSIGGYWYFVDDLGHILKNQFIDDFYVGPTGKMLKNYWIKEDINGDKIYLYAGNDGKILKNIMVEIAGFDYCFNEEGVLIRNQFFYDNIEKKLVWAENTGRVSKVNDFLKINGKYYYIDEDGNVLQNTWVNYEGEEYYLDELGVMATNQWIDGKYYVDESGKKLKNAFAPDGTKLDENGEIIWENVISRTLKDAKLYSSYLFGKYEQDGNLENGKEDIEWIILYKDEEKVLLYSKYILDNKAYNEEAIDITWENSDIRKFLNNEFLNETFSDEEKNLILTTINVNDKNEITKTEGGNNTEDKVFLLSIAEAQNFFGKATKDKSGYTNNKRLATTGTEYAKSQGLVVNDDDTWAKGNSAFWLRSPGVATDFASGVDFYGDINNEGGNDLVSEKHGIRVALYIKIN